MRRAVFLDRDGTINRMVYKPDFGLVDSPSNPAEFDLLPGIGEAIRAINEMGFLAIVVSNQPGIAKGKFSPPLLEAMTAKMHSGLAEAGARLDAVYYCLHHPEAVDETYRVHCDCRKPNPGLLKRASQEWQIDLSQSYLIGDGITDMGAGQAVGATTILLNSRKGYVYDELARQGVRPNCIVSSPAEAVEVIQGFENGDGADEPNGFAMRATRGIGEGNHVDGERIYALQYLDEAVEIIRRMDVSAIEHMAHLMVQLRERGGRLFFLGVGGGAGHASHAVNDFRKIAGIEAYTPTDNVSELTARVNDDGWETTYVSWLRTSRLKADDMVFVFSVGGGDADWNISANLVRALQYAQEVGATICGVVGRDGGYTAQVADGCVIVATVNPEAVTPHTESFQAMIWHLLVSHPRLKAAEMKWESTALG